MKKSNKSIPNFSNQTFKLMEVGGKEEIFAQDFHSDEWNDGKEEFGVRKINQLTSLVDDLVKKVKELIDNKDNLYYEGEYKWMPTRIETMPTGWAKINMDKGFTLIANNSEGTSSGEIKSHLHYASSSMYMPGWIPVATQSNIGNTQIWGGSNQTNEYVPHISSARWTEWDNPRITTIIDKSGVTNNLAAGISASLWQYDPNGTFTKLREEAIKNQKLKEELESKK